MSWAEYDQYIQSPSWRAKALLRLALDNYECNGCGSTENLEVHHRHYKNFKNENLDDLRVFCSVCHEALTNAQRAERHKKRRHQPTETKRQTPKIESKNTYGSANIELSDHRRSSPGFAQRPNRGPA